MKTRMEEAMNYLNTNDMVNDYYFMYQIIYQQKPMDFEATA